MTGSKFSMVRKPALIGLSLLTLGLSACASLPKLGKPSAEDRAKATQGERISITAFEQKISPSKSLQGIGYYLPSASETSDWSSPSADHTENLAAGGSLKVAWSRSIGEGAKDGMGLIAQPVSDGKYIYTLDARARIKALDVSTGREIWSVDLNPHLKRDKVAFGGGLSLLDGKLFVTSGYRFVTAIDATTGASIWKRTLDTQVHAAPVASGNLVMITDVENQVFAYDAATGEMKWTYQAISEPARVLKSASALVIGNQLIAPFSSGELVGIDVSSGQPSWSQTLSESNRTNALSQIRDIAGMPVYHEGVIYAVSHAGQLAAIDPAQGNIKWKLNADSVNAPWIAGDVLFLITVQGELICVSRQSGQVYWVKDINQLTGKKKTLFAKNDKAAEAEDDKPSKKKKKSKDLAQWTGPVLASDQLLLFNSEGEILALDPKSGDMIKQVKIGGPIYISPISIGNKLFVLTDDAKLVAIE